MANLTRSRPEPDVVPAKYEMPTAFSSLQRQMNRLFDDVFSGWPGRALEAESAGPFMPAVDVAETDEALSVQADLPGMSDKDIEVTLSPDGQELMLKGERKYEAEKREGDAYRAERSWGSFRRTIGLPTAVDPDKVEANFKNGVLTVRLPKAAGAKKAARKIEIKPG